MQKMQRKLVRKEMGKPAFILRKSLFANVNVLNWMNYEWRNAYTAKDALFSIENETEHSSNEW